MKKSIYVGCLIASCLSLQNCSYITVIRTRELREVQTRVDTLYTRLATAQSQVLENQQKQDELLRGIRADVQSRFGELEQRIADLEGGINENQQQLSRINEKTQALHQQIAEKAKTDSTAKATLGAESENLFQIAYNDFTAGRFDLAMTGFKDLVTKYPDSPQAEESSYWIAECYNAQKNNADAERSYIEYIKFYPNGKKICSALYKMGLIYEREKKSKSQKMVWDKVKAQCPNSEEAKSVDSRSVQ